MIDVVILAVSLALSWCLFVAIYALSNLPEGQGAPHTLQTRRLQATYDAGAMVLQHGAHPDAAFVSELATLDEWIGVPRDSEEAEQAPPNRDGESMCRG